MSKFGVQHASSSELLRNAVASGSTAGKEVRLCHEQGKDISDELLSRVVIEALSSEQRFVEKGWLLDGFPRTASQAAALSAAGLAPHAILELNIPDATLLSHAAGRRIDPETHTIYQLNGPNPPTDPAVVSRLVSLADDR